MRGVGRMGEYEAVYREVCRGIVASAEPAPGPLERIAAYQRVAGWRLRDGSVGCT